MHQTIYDKPMKLYRVRDTFINAANFQRGKHTRDSHKPFSRRLAHEGGEQPGLIEEPMCFLGHDGRLHCSLARDETASDTSALDMKTILGVISIFIIRQAVLDAEINRYQGMIDSGKQPLQAEYRTLYKSYTEFVKARGRSISSQEWIQFQEDCIRLVALRKVLYNHPIPYEARQESGASFAQMLPDSEYVASNLRGLPGAASSSRQPVAAGQKDVGSTSSGASDNGGFVRSAKARKMYGELCMLGDDDTQGADIQFKDIAHEPYVTLFLEDVLGVRLSCITNGPLLAQLLIKARHISRTDREGAELTCSHLLKERLTRDVTQLADLVRIGSKKAEEDYDQLMGDCLYHVVLRCVLEGKPTQVVIGKVSTSSP